MSAFAACRTCGVVVCLETDELYDGFCGSCADAVEDEARLEAKERLNQLADSGYSDEARLDTETSAPKGFSGSDLIDDGEEAEDDADEGPAYPLSWYHDPSIPMDENLGDESPAAPIDERLIALAPMFARRAS